MLKTISGLFLLTDSVFFLFFFLNHVKEIQVTLTTEVQSVSLEFPYDPKEAVLIVGGVLQVVWK